MRCFILVAVMAVASVALTGCRISTPDTADSGSGFEAEVYNPFMRPCVKAEPKAEEDAGE